MRDDVERMNDARENKTRPVHRQGRTSTRKNIVESTRQPVGLICFIVLLVFLFHPILCLASGLNLPAVNVNLDDAKGPEQISGVLQIIFLLTVLSLAPAVLILMTSFTRFAIVFSFLRYALGTQQSPPNQIIIGLALFLTFFIMQPVWQRIHQEAIVPYERHEISGEELVKRGATPLKEFMLKHTKKPDLALFVSIAQKEKPLNAEAIPISTIIPAFVISELKTAFQIGFMLYIPFIILDMVVASILLSMGMMMLPPVMISLPFKLMLFILVDGWNLLIGSLVKSFQ
ncbi:MAG TPA: flagellar type III secretion system pore protein FliP [Syntrophobacteraceae bacterium]|nr:flagellar type III secretion system pore protein FliP [Syntrophobacteraceae bacterium]